MAEITETFEKFVKKLYDQELIELKDGYLYWGRAICQMKNWPSQLDTENFEIKAIYESLVTGYAGGDWQDCATFNLVYDKDKNKIILQMFDDPSCFSCGEKYKEKDIIEVLTKNNKSVKESLVNEFLKRQK